MIIKTLIFSKDRAMQLDAVLRSFFLHCQDASLTEMAVLYKPSDARHEQQYRILAECYPQVRFHPEDNFRQDVLRLLSPYRGARQVLLLGLGRLTALNIKFSPFLERLRERTIGRVRRWIIRGKLFGRVPDEYILFLVDDNIFVRDFSLTDTTASLKAIPGALGFSLRLGRNTIYCYTRNVKQKVPDFIEVDSGILQYRWTGAEYDFGYPLDVSCSIYPNRIIVPFLATLRFYHPNSLEGKMASLKWEFTAKYPLLLCYDRSVSFCNPVNMVQTTVHNRAGETHAYLVDELLERFESGERIKVEEYNNFQPNSCHQEVAFVFDRNF